MRMQPGSGVRNMLVLSVLTSTIAVPGTAQSWDWEERAPDLTVSEILDTLQSWDPGPTDRDVYRDSRHRWLHPLIEELMNRRYAATEAVCERIESLDPEHSPHFVEALQSVISFVKDPAVIPWLEKWDRDPARRFTPHWYVMQTTWHSQLLWLDEPRTWSRYFRQKLAGTKEEEERLAIIKAMSLLQNEETVSFLERRRRNSACSSIEYLAISAYLATHGRSVDANRLEKAIEEVWNGPEKERWRLALYSERFRHQAFIPRLIELLDTTSRGSAKLNLARITFRECESADGWRKWYAENESVDRSVWVRDAETRLKNLAKNDLAGAKAFLDGVYRTWNDPLLLPTMRELAKYPELHSGIVDWIALTYEPPLRSELAALANMLVSDGTSHLEEGDVMFLQELGFLEGGELSWEDTVRIANIWF